MSRPAARTTVTAAADRSDVRAVHLAAAIAREHSVAKHLGDNVAAEAPRPVATVITAAVDASAHTCTSSIASMTSPIAARIFAKREAGKGSER